MRFVSRRQWDAAYAQGSGPIPGPVRGVTCHWEGPWMGYPWPHHDCAGKVRSIERYHAVSKGWAGIAYNALVCPHGYVYEGRGVHVRSAANGESNIGGNDQWYALCYLAGVGDEFTAEGRAAMLEAITWLRHAGDAGRQVNGHRDHHPTECPGDVIYRWVQAGIPPADEPVLEDDMRLDDNIRPGKGDDLTVGQLFNRIDRFIADSSQRERKMMRLVNGIPEEVAATVAKELGGSLPSSITEADLKRIVYNRTRRAIDSRLGSLDE